MPHNIHDPVCFLLCKHDVAYNFLYKNPASGLELLMQWFVGRELYIAYTLSRRFFWQDNILWPDQLQCPCTVVLSANDQIVPAYAVYRYLTSWAANNNVDRSKLQVELLPETSHAGFLLCKETQGRIIDNILTVN